MAPRATVQQAIELLKIHQIRRENAAIYQQLQDLRDDVADLESVTNDTRKELSQLEETSKTTGDLVANTQQKLRNIDDDLAAVRRDKDGLQTLIIKAEHRCEQHTKNNQVQHDLLLNKIDTLERRNKDTDEKTRLYHDSFTERLDEVLELVVQKADQEQLLSMCDLLGRNDIDSLAVCNNERCRNPISAVSNSIEGSNDQMSKKHASRRMKPLLGDSLGLSNSAEALGAHSGIPLDGVDPQNLTVLDDTDLDETTIRLALTEHNNDRAPQDQPFVVLPHLTDQEEQCIDEILTLRQGQFETVLAYLRRSYTIMNIWPTTSQSIVVHKVIDGLADERDRRVFTKWLENTSWSVQNLKNIASLHNISKQDMDPSTSLDKLSSEQRRDHELTADILVPATETPDSMELAWVNQTTSPKFTVIKPIVRRSQRIAEKSQAGQKNRLTPGPEAEDRVGERSTDMISIVAKKGENEKFATLTKKRKRADDGFPMSDLVKAGNKAPCRDKGQEVALHDMQNPFDKPTRKTVQASTNAGGVDALSPLCTPKRGILLSRRSTIRPRINASSLSPLAAKQAKDRTRGLPPKRFVKPGIRQSPYDPKPQLVLDPVRTETRPRQLSSDTDVVLPQQTCRPSHQAQILHGEKVERVKKKRRLPLPPPPEIPILSTSTEEDRRFDRW